MKIQLLVSICLLGIVMQSNAQVPSYVPTSGLAGWWPFNGNANDESGNGNNGSNNGATLTTDRNGKTNSSYDFNGTSNFISIPDNNSLDLSNQYTISVWISIPDYSFGPALPDGSNNYDYQRTILGKPRTSGWATGYNLTMEPTGSSTKLVSAAAGMTCCPNTGIWSKTTPALNTWYNLTVVYNGTSFSIFINGVIDTTIQKTYTLDNSSQPLLFGKEFVSVSNNWYRWYKGKLDDIGIWNRALTQQEILNLYNGCQLSISTEPTNQFSNLNGQVEFTTLASDTTSSYQWQSNASNMGWANIPSNSLYSGVTTKKLTLNNIQVNNHKQLFRVIANNNICKDTSAVAMLTVNDTCITSTTDTLYIKVNTSSLNNPIYNTLKVYPNPSSTQVIIDNGIYNIMGSYTAKIVNSLGQQVFQSVINQQQFVIDVNIMGGAGVYTLYITNANNKVVGVKKIVLQ